MSQVECALAEQGKACAHCDHAKPHKETIKCAGTSCWRDVKKYQDQDHAVHGAECVPVVGPADKEVLPV